MNEPRDVDARIVARGHEHDTTRVGRVLLVVSALAVAVAAALIVLWYLRDDLSATIRVAAPDSARSAPAPDFSYARNWVRRADALGSRRDEEQRLSTYGWVDREQGVIHVPVERAIELLADEGLRVAAPPPEDGR